MTKIKIKSSNIEYVSYNRKAQILTIKFHRSDTLYHYSGVSAYIFSKLLDAPSAGQYFVQKIKHQYSFNKS